jgi:hypothetical protein
MARVTVTVTPGEPDVTVTVLPEPTATHAPIKGLIEVPFWHNVDILVRHPALNVYRVGTCDHPYDPPYMQACLRLEAQCKEKTWGPDCCHRDDQTCTYNWNDPRAYGVQIYVSESQKVHGCPKGDWECVFRRRREECQSNNIWKGAQCWCEGKPGIECRDDGRLWKGPYWRMKQDQIDHDKWDREWRKLQAAAT